MIIRIRIQRILITAAIHQEGESGLGRKESGLQQLYIKKENPDYGAKNWITAAGYWEGESGLGFKGSRLQQLEGEP